MAQQSGATTKSIDVGGVFLMDLSVCEACEPSECELPMAGPFDERQRLTHSTHNHRAVHARPTYDTTKPTSHNHLPQSMYRASQQPHAHPHHNHQDKSIRLSPTTYRQYGRGGGGGGGGRRAPTQQPETAGSLEGLASVINCDRQHDEDDDDEDDGRPLVPPTTTTTTTRRYQVDGKFRDEEEAAAAAAEEEDPLSSLSDESYLPTSSGTSLSVSLTGSSDLAADGYGPDAGQQDRALDDDEDGETAERDKESTTTREDSGVLDMKEDLGGRGDEAGQPQAGDTQQTGQPEQVPRSLERGDRQRPEPQPPTYAKPGQEKSISANIMATNLINKTATDGNMNFHHQATTNNINYNRQQQQQKQQKPMQQQHRSISKPTDGSNNHQTHNTHNHHHHQHQHHPTHVTPQVRGNARAHSGPQRSKVSASLPIQVPARQMKKNLNRMKLKLKLMKDSDVEEATVAAVATGQQEAAAQQQQQQQVAELDASIVRRGDRNRPALESMAAFCAGQDDDAFLEQEFNANHHNHYPIDELDSEHLTAGEDPMRLFASIQALAKSLHEDAELFGSLPPKRMLESPIRSLALA